MIQLNTRPGERYLELGGGENPHPACQVNVDVRQGSKTHFTADFNEPLPIASDEWDGVYSCFTIEHISWRKAQQFISEVYRILKPGGNAVIITANTEAQMQKCLRQTDWGEEESRIIFGDMDYPENSHKNSLNPRYAAKLFQEAGFHPVQVLPYGEIATDLCIIAVKPHDGQVKETVSAEVKGEILPTPQLQPVPPEVPSINHAGLSTEERAALFDHAYFDCGQKIGGYPPPGYADFPCHEITARHILARRPESVLELGCSRGYVLKRLQDVGIPAGGMDISNHAYLTRVATSIEVVDLCKGGWVVPDEIHRSERR